jgi:hypothetical protein
MLIISDKPMPESLIAELKARDRAAVARIEANPWTHELRKAKAEAERTGSNSPLVAFEQRFFAARKAGDPWLA